MNYPPEQNVRPRSPAPHIDPVLLWPTPSNEDLLFYVERNGDLPVNKTWEYGEPFRDPLTYPKHKLVYVAPQTADKWSRWYYAADRVLEDEYNWEFADADIGGTRFRAVTRTYLTLKEDFDPLVPAMGALMEDLPRGKFTTPYVLANRGNQKIGDETLNSLYTVETRTYVQKTQLVGVLVDEFSNKSNRVTVDLYYRGEIATGATTIEDLFDTPTNAWWSPFSGTVGTTTTMYRREGKQLTTNWFSVETVPIISGALDGSELIVHDYETTVDYTWPAVLSEVTVDEWPRRDGAVVRISIPVYARHRYSGPCNARVVTKWKNSSYTDIGVGEAPIPIPVSVANPYFQVSTPPSLHAEINFSFTNGTTDPVFKYVDKLYHFPATNYPDWSVLDATGLIVADTQKPYKGGFLRETVTVFPPLTDYVPLTVLPTP